MSALTPIKTAASAGIMDGSTLLSPSGRPRRSTVQVNYAEATDEASESGKKGRSAPRATVPKRQPPNKNLLRMIQLAGGYKTKLTESVQKSTGSSKKKKKGQKRRAGVDEDESDEEESEEEEDDISDVEDESKTGAASQKKNTATGPSPKYVARLVIACEEVCSRDAALLKEFHVNLTKAFPLIPANLDKIRTAMEKTFTKRVLQRIETQLAALGPHGAPADAFVNKSARTPLLSTCSKCSTTRSFLRTICSECHQHKDKLTLQQFVDWRLAVKKQRELDEYDAKQNDSKKKDDDAASPTSPTADSTPSSSHSTLQSTPSKRQKTATVMSPSSEATPSKKRESSDDADELASIPVPDEKWIREAREAITVRAIKYIRVCVAKGRKGEFEFHGGDIIFLLRNAIFKGRGTVATESRAVVSEMLRRWDSTMLTIISDNSEPAHILGYSECLHAKKEMEWHSKEDIDRLTQRVKSALSHHCSEDILRFDASQFLTSLPRAAYCHPCGEFHSGSKGLCPACANPLRMEEDFEFLCESLVWTSLYRELTINPVTMADTSVSFENLLHLMQYIRPYKSLAERGQNSFKLQCYFITHFTFVLTRWGAVAMKPRTLFVEEYLFLLANMDVVIRWKDPELVGEFLQALHILDTPHDHPVMQKGYHFLLCHEKKGKMRGNWVNSNASYYQRYHAAYCGIIGMAEFEFEDEAKEKYSHEFDRFLQ